jgi:hypothetical protein
VYAHIEHGDRRAMTVVSTTLGGTLARYPDGWRWRDGTPEPRCRDMALADIAPNFRCCTVAGVAYVEIPRRYRDARYWPRGRVDDDAAAAIAALLAEGGERAPIYAEVWAERTDEHRLTVDGYRVPVALWDAAMREPCGCWWDAEHEADILARARSLGWTG